MFHSLLVRATVSLTCLFALLVITACDTTKRGRLDPYETTREEARSDKVSTTALLEFSDQVPDRLIQDLYDLPIIRDTDGRVNVLIGDFNNQTRIVPTSDFEMIAQRIRNELINSKVATSKLRFTEKRARVERLAAGEKVLNPDGSPVDAPAYDATRTYLLLGDFYRTNRANTNLYYMQFQLVNTASNDIVFSDRYEVKQAN
jgi:hypothetical protein